MFKITGTIKVLNPTVQVSEKFAKREFVLTENTSQYPQDILFQAVQDRCAMLDTMQVGEQVEVSFNLRGREWTSPQGEVKFFNSLDAWRIEKMGHLHDLKDVLVEISFLHNTLFFLSLSCILASAGFISRPIPNHPNCSNKAVLLL